MVDFPSSVPAPTAPLEKDKKYRTLEATFGDGYSQRAGDGLNNIIEEFAIVWDVLTEAEKTVLTDFFDARQGYDSFNYTMPGDASSKKWRVKSYKENKITAAWYKITAIFERVYDI